MAVHVVEEELVKSNATRAFLVGYLVSLSYDAIRQLEEFHEGKADDLTERLDEVYPLIEKEFYGQLVRRKQEPKSDELNHTAQSGAAPVETAEGHEKVL